MAIPLEKFALSKEKCVNPGITTRKARKADALGIAKALYQTDPYIYPGAFGHDAEKAAKALTYLVEMEDGLFSYRNIMVALDGTNVIGTALCLRENNVTDIRIYLSSMCGEINNETDFKYAFENYFSKQGCAVGTVSLMAFAFDEKYRGKNGGRALLSFMEPL